MDVLGVAVAHRERVNCSHDRSRKRTSTDTAPKRRESQGAAGQARHRRRPRYASARSSTTTSSRPSSTFRTEPQSVDEVRAQWAQRHQRFPWLVATDDDHVVGVAYAGPWNERAAYRWTVESTIYVDPSAHRRGVGDALYTELLDRLRREGFHSAVAVIALPNDPSVRLHERHGFARVGHLRRGRLTNTTPGTTSVSGSASWMATSARRVALCSNSFRSGRRCAAAPVARHRPATVRTGACVVCQPRSSR